MSKPGVSIFNRIFHKGINPVNTQRVVISDTEKRSKSEKEKKKKVNLASIDFFDIEEENLEETPVGNVIPDKPEKRGKHAASKAPKNLFASEPVPAAQNSRIPEKRFKNKKSVSGIIGGMPSVFHRESKTSNSSALEFAESKKRVGKKGRKYRRIAIYAGTGVLVIVLMLVVVLVPGGAAAPTNIVNSPAGSAVSTQGTEYIANVTGGNSPIVSVSEEATGTEVSAGYSAEVSVSPAVSVTPERTAVQTTAPDETLPPINVANEVQKFMVQADRYYNDMGYSSTHYNYTEEEKHMLSQVIWKEARGEGLTGMIAVGNVVMNRVLSRAFPGDTIKSVLTTGQFAYYPDGKTNSLSNRAANLVLDYEKWVIPQNIYFFKVPSSANPTENWSSGIIYHTTINNHAFYSAKRYGRRDLIPPELFERTYKWPTMGCKPEDRVYRLQYMLNKLGYDVKADKYFGQDTKDAIIEFQKMKGLKADGVAGPDTLEALIYEFGLDQYYMKFCIES